MTPSTPTSPPSPHGPTRTSFALPPRAYLKLQDQHELIQHLRHLVATTPPENTHAPKRQIEESVCQYARDAGMLVYKFTSPNKAAVPDRLFITPKKKGTSWFIEVQAGWPEAPRPKQRGTSVSGAQGHGVRGGLDDHGSGVRGCDEGLVMSAYYNEFDKYAAQWLRNLIAAGHIAPGDVDERSISDVRPSDLVGTPSVTSPASEAGSLQEGGLTTDPSGPASAFSVAGRDMGG